MLAFIGEKLVDKKLVRTTATKPGCSSCLQYNNCTVGFFYARLASGGKGGCLGYQRIVLSVFFLSIIVSQVCGIMPHILYFLPFSISWLRLRLLNLPWWKLFHAPKAGFTLSNLPTVQAGCRFYATVSFMDERQASVNRVARICCSCIGISTRLLV